MFSRRRAASNPPKWTPAAPTSGAAALAASQAFLKDRASTASLSNAAAAAALRSHTTSPAPVGDVQTKRMIRRGSTSSQGSTGSAQAPGLRRQSSSGSMSERTFRASSPHRSDPVVPADPNAPPVPAIPRDVPSPIVQKRASSLEPPVRGPSQRRGGGRGVSVDRGMPAAGRGHTRGGSSLAQVLEVDRENSTRSINFSRPMSPPASPSPSPVAARGGHSGWFASPVTENNTFRDDSVTRPKTADGADIRNYFIKQSVRNAPDMPVHKNRNQSAGGVEGARLSTGHMGARTTGTAVDDYSRPSTSSGTPVDPKSPGAVYDPSTRRFVQKQPTQPSNQGSSYPTSGRPQSPPFQRVERPQSPPVQRIERPQSPPVRRVERPQSPPIQRPQSPPTQMSPSTGFQTRAGALLARRSSEDYGEDDQELRAQKSLVSTASPATPSQPIQPRALTPTNTLSTPQSGNGRGGRQPSLSPGRSAHFATSSVELPNGVKHQPPPRSISPAKSALKHSPSSSLRTHSPVVFSSRGAPSEASDTMSDDGFRSTPRRKKNVRVSFDDGPVMAAETSPTSPKGAENSTFSSRSPTSTEGDFDEVLAPRPELPSFGSVRERSRRTGDEDLAEKVTETIPSSMSTSASTIAEPLEASNDHALGSIVAHDFASKGNRDPSISQREGFEPVPPEVTSVEGSGYVSDSDSASIQDEAPRQELAIPDIAVLPATPGPDEEPEPKYIMPGGFPDQFEEERFRANKERVDAQKGSTSQEPSTSGTVKPTNSTSPNIPVQSSREVSPDVREHSDDSGDESIYSDAEENISDDDTQFASLDAIVDSPISKPVRGLAITTPPDSPVVRTSNDSDPSPRTGNWNAAAEHWSSVSQAQSRALESEAKPTAPKASPAAPVAPVLQAAKPRNRDTPTGSASKAAPTSRSNVQQQTPAQARAQPRKSALKNSMRQDQGSTASEPHIRKTMRTGNAFQESHASSVPETHMKRSMRGDDTGRVGMRVEPGLAASKYSTPPQTREPRGALQKKNLPAAVPAKARPQSAFAPVATGPKQPQMPPLGRTFSDDDSDASASSFRRERRRPKGSNGEAYSMKRSMRGGPAPSATSAPAPTMRPQSVQVKPLAPPPTLRTSMRPSSPTPSAPPGLRSSRFSIRSLSPSGGGMMGNSRRTGSIDATASATPTLRTQVEKPGTKFGGFGKASKPKAAAPRKTASRFQSRFADSSDEDDDRPVRFNSRFADSDEEDDYTMPAGLAPVRGIPRKPGADDGDSTDLSDEDSNDERLAASANKDIEKSVIPPKTNGQQDVSFANSSLRNGQSTKKDKKRGFFSLGKKKHPSGQPGEVADVQPLPIPDPPAHTWSPTQAQRPLTPIGEDDKAIEAGVVSTPQSPGSTRSPKLQRRNTPQWGRSTSDSWPLAQPPKIGETGRPASSDGLSTRPQILRPTMSKRHSSVVSSAVSEARIGIDPKTGKEVIVGRTGKKKRFPMLRKAFGLND